MGLSRTLAAPSGKLAASFSLALLVAGCAKRVEFDPLRTIGSGERVTFQTIRSVDVEEERLPDGTLAQGFPLLVDASARTDWRTTTFSISEAGGSAVLPVFALAARKIYPYSPNGTVRDYAFPDRKAQRFFAADPLWRGLAYFGQPPRLPELSKYLSQASPSSV